jgi:uncharacterized phage-associated protein
MAGAIDVASAFVQRSGERLSHLALQKYVYLAHMLFSGMSDGKSLIDDSEFQAWDYGPVSPVLYRRLRGFGSLNIPRVLLSGAESLDRAGQEAVDEIWRELSGVPAAKLVEITHSPLGAWAKVYQPGVKGIPIPQFEIFNEYKRRQSKSR